jgi:uncharacterized membrane protein YkoI
VGGALVASTLTGGAIGATFLSAAGAADSSTASTPAASSGAAAQPDRTRDWSSSGHQANGTTEALLNADDTAKAKAAAEAAVPGATAQRIETDAEGATYEVHMTKSDGSIVTVKLDGDFTVTETVDGMG